MVRISNLELLEFLERNSRTPFVSIAEKLKVSETAVRKRVKILEDERIIERYTIEVYPKKVGYNVRVMIGVDTKPESYITHIEKLKSKKEVRSLYSASGDHMILAECWFENTKDFTNFVKSLEKEKGVTKVCPAVILERVK